MISRSKLVISLVRIFLIALTLATTCLSLSSQTKADIGQDLSSHRLGISVQAAGDGNYGEAFAAAKLAGMQSVTLSLNWNDLEPAKVHYDDKYLLLANSFYPRSKTSVDLILRPIDTNHLCLPDDLAGKPFSSPEVIERFERLLDNVFENTRDLQINSLAVGNEVDGVLQNNPTMWDQYKHFYDTIMAYIHHLRPTIKTGVVITYLGLTGPESMEAQSLNADSDVIMTTYYPLKPDFTVLSPSVVFANFDQLCGIAGKKSIVISEAGYPSASVCGSSPSLQAQFVNNVFSAWDTHSSQIESITFSWLNDISPTEVKDYGRYYGVNTNYFSEFLRTLGLRTYDGGGTDKPAYIALKKNAMKRNL